MSEDVFRRQPIKAETVGPIVLRVNGKGQETYRNRNNAIEEVLTNAGTDAVTASYTASGALAYPFHQARTDGADTWHFSMLGKVTSAVAAGSGTVTEIVDFDGTLASGAATFQSMVTGGTSEDDIVLMIPVQRIDNGTRVYMSFPAGGSTNSGECKITGYAGSGGAGVYVNGTELFHAIVSDGYGAAGDADSQPIIVSNRAGSAFGNIIPVGVRIQYTRHSAACGARFIYEKPGIIG